MGVPSLLDSFSGLSWEVSPLSSVTGLALGVEDSDAGFDAAS